MYVPLKTPGHVWIKDRVVLHDIIESAVSGFSRTHLLAYLFEEEIDLNSVNLPNQFLLSQLMVEVRLAMKQATVS